MLHIKRIDGYKPDWQWQLTQLKLDQAWRAKQRLKRMTASLHHTAGYQTNPNMSYLYRPK